MIDLSTAAELLDFSASIGPGPTATRQLEGAVALHNLLEAHGVAYLADEVGMGKTYVALGALALFRHFQPDFRVLVIAPRENIQAKWMKELRNFVRFNVRFPDLRVKAIDDHPARRLVSCGNLIDLVREATLDPNRDFFARMTSFSLAVAGTEKPDPETVRKLRDSLREQIPWLSRDVFDLRDKLQLKDNIARAICCAMPQFDLVIIDEGHNLKHGFREHVAARNRVLAHVLGHPRGAGDPHLFPGYGPRAKRVLILSATPVEESYHHLWNQLDVVGFGSPYEKLKRADIEEDEKKALAAQFLIRRVTSIRVQGQELTKNLYRREWRAGGVAVHDDPIAVLDPRQRLIVALVQKKVSELLGHERFNASFQIGMLASFESFLETARLKHEEAEDEASNFDDSEQTEDELEREGIDVGDINRLARSYRQKFGKEMPHPKMDAVVASLSDAWRLGRKRLVFVRRVASVKELKRKLDESYDAWLLDRLRRELPVEVLDRFEGIVRRYRDERLASTGADSAPLDITSRPEKGTEQDRGGTDTFFAWFFRGEGPSNVISGANIQQRFIQRGTVYATFFEDNLVADLLGVEPGTVTDELCRVLSVDRQTLTSGLRERSRRFLSRAKKPPRADRFDAVQAAAIEWLKDTPGPLQEKARIVWHQHFEASLQLQPAATAPDIGDWLEHRTFFTELRKRPELMARLWPQPVAGNLTTAFREQQLRGQLIASVARLGHGLIDLYVMTIRRLKSLELKSQPGQADDESSADLDAIHEYLDLLDQQMRTPVGAREWGVFDELAEVADNFNLILDVNEPDARTAPLAETTRVLGRLLRQQQPVGGMFGQVNRTLVRQFRMPGYPLVLISTDLLQEGEDLHTFCSDVHHYGISWTPSSMEQRIGRIDRVRSQTDRRLTAGTLPIDGKDKLQVYFPYLEETIEVLQVERVLDRMNTFLRLMHEGLVFSVKDERTINADKAFAGVRKAIPRVQELLKSAFPVRPEHLRGEARRLAVGPDVAGRLAARFHAIPTLPLPGLEITWEPRQTPGTLLGTARLTKRIQPFALLLRTIESRPLVRCISPIGCVEPELVQDEVVDSVVRQRVRVGAIQTKEERTYDLTVEGDVLLADDPATDAARIATLIRRVVEPADRLEDEHMEGRDEALATFRDELGSEGTDGS